MHQGFEAIMRQIELTLPFIALAPIECAQQHPADIKNNGFNCHNLGYYTAY